MTDPNSTDTGLSYLADSLALMRPERVLFPLNWAGHTPFAFWIVEALRPNRIVELGTHAGLSYCAFCQAVKQLELSTQCYAVDSWEGDEQAGQYDDSVYLELQRYHDQRYASFSRLLRSMFDDALVHFEDGSIDLLHIDGFHTYEAVQHDFNTWRAKLSDRAVVLFHDVNVREGDFGCWRFWNEVSEQYPSFRFEHSHGLGVLFVGSQRNERLQWLANAGKQRDRRQVRIQSFFEKLGKCVTEEYENERAANEIAGRDHEIHKRDQDIVMYVEQREQLQNRVSELETHASTVEEARGKDVERLEHECRVEQDKVAEERARIEALKEELQAAKERTAELDHEYAEQLRVQAEISEKWQAQHDHRLAIAQSVSEKLQARAAVLKAKLDDARRAQDRLNADGFQVALRLGAAARIEKEVAKLKLDLEEISSTRSWRLTSPFRALYDGASKVAGAAFDLMRAAAWALQGVMRVRRKELGELRLLQESGLFDASYYSEQFPGAGCSTQELIYHYLRTGAELGAKPHPLFDPKYYLDRNEDVASSDENPFVHFVRIGWREQRDPHPLFSMQFYCSSNPSVPEGVNPLLYFCEVGFTQDFDPHPLMSLSYYLQHNTDVAAGGSNPLEHFVRYGDLEGRNCHPLFDPKFYAGSFEACDECGKLQHYLTEGYKHGVAPHPLFDVRHYREQATVKNLGIPESISPLTHYLLYGGRAGVSPNPEFDHRYYAYHNPDAAHLDGFCHYVEHGMVEGRRPGPLFDPQFYESVHVDLAGQTSSLLEHYHWHGRSEGRAAHPRDQPSYKEWSEQVLLRTDFDRAHINKQIAKFQDKPTLTVLLLVTDWQQELLESTIESLQMQLYKDWELVLVDNNSQTASVRDVIADLDELESRIHVLTHECLDDASGALQAGLAKARGEYLSVIERPVLLEDHALYLVAEGLQQKHKQLVYSDSAVRESDGSVHSPSFKPDWNQSLLASGNYCGPVVFFDRPLFDKISNSVSAKTGDVGYEALLLLAEDTEPEDVHHIRTVSYHVASGFEPCLDSEEAHLITSQLLSRWTGLSGLRSAKQASGYHEPHPSMPEERPLISVIVPTRDGLDLLRQCVEGVLEETDYPQLELCIIDNNSEQEETLAYLNELERDRRVRVVKYPHRFNYADMNNRAAKQVAGDYLVFLNNDIEIRDPKWLEKLFAYSQMRSVGVVGTKLLYPDGTIQHAGVIIGKNGLAGHSFSRMPADFQGAEGRAQRLQEVSAVTAACMLTKREVFESLGGFDSERFEIAFNDIDFSLRVREAGYKVLYMPYTDIVHHESASLGPPDQPKRKAQFEREWASFENRWAKRIFDDEHYNPNLSLGEHDYALADESRYRAPWMSRPKRRVAQKGLLIDTEKPLDLYVGTTNLGRSREVTGSVESPLSQKQWLPGLSVVILNLNRPEFICPLLDSLVEAKSNLAQEGMALQILVGDTGSTDLEVLASYEKHSDQVMIVQGLEYQFSRCNNHVFEKHAIHDTVLFLNNDIEFESGATETLGLVIETMKDNPNIGTLGCELLYPDRRVQHAGIEFFRSGRFEGLSYHPKHGESIEEDSISNIARPVGAVTGAFLVTRSQLFAEVGGFDESYAEECQDVALCLTIRRMGFSSLVFNAGTIIHYENGTRDKGSENWLDRTRFLRQWQNYVGTF